MTTSHQTYAVITGASSGLGKSFAFELASRGINLILVSLPGEGLRTTARKLISEYAVSVQYYETDLALKDNVVRLADWINLNYEIFLLINNAGIGGTKRFIEACPEYINTILQLNIMATSILSRKLLDNLLRQSQSYILNVASIAAFSPIGYKTVYPASKSFVYSFSCGLNAELADTPVFVSVVNPGPMRTSKEIIARIEKQGWFARLLSMKPNEVARNSIDKLFEKHSVIIFNPLSLLMINLIPSRIRVPLMTNLIKRELHK